jgi:hypothetical protein
LKGRWLKNSWNLKRRRSYKSLHSNWRSGNKRKTMTGNSPPLYNSGTTKKTESITTFWNGARRRRFRIWHCTFKKIMADVGLFFSNI